MAYFTSAWISSLLGQQLGLALVELVVAHGVELQPNLVERFHRGLVEEQRRHQRRGADEVARATTTLSGFAAFSFAT
jgi:hypothetical protein